MELMNFYGRMAFILCFRFLFYFFFSYSVTVFNFVCFFSQMVFLELLNGSSARYLLPSLVKCFQSVSTRYTLFRSLESKPCNFDAFQFCGILPFPSASILFLFSFFLCVYVCVSPNRIETKKRKIVNLFCVFCDNYSFA